MNHIESIDLCFRPQQGLTIMNKNGYIYGVSEKCFRPQQGLTIMNLNINVFDDNYEYEFPSPTGVNHYE